MHWREKIEGTATVVERAVDGWPALLRAGGLHFAIPRAAVVEILHDNNEMMQIADDCGAKIATIRSIRPTGTDCL